MWYMWYGLYVCGMWLDICMECGGVFRYMVYMWLSAWMSVCVLMFSICVMFGRSMDNHSLIVYTLSITSHYPSYLYAYTYT